MSEKEYEKLDSKWIDEHRKSYTMEDSVEVSELQNLLVPKQELPVIPKYVADWVTQHRKDFDLYPALRRLESNSLNWQPAYKWYRMNTHEFVNAYLTGEYEVKEDPVYYALVKGHELVNDEGDIACKCWNLRLPTGDVFPSNRYSRRGEFLVKMSKSEWNKLGINDSNADFVKVGETT